MKKILTSLAAIVLMAGSVTSAVAATDQNKIPAPYIDPSIPSKGQKEANQINYDSVTLNDTPTKSYLNTTAEQDKSIIEQQLEANQELDPKTAGDFTFDNTTPLQWYVKNRISYQTKASDGSKGSGVLDIYVNPYTPGPSPTPHKKASKLIPSNPKESTIGPSNPKASIIGPSTKKKEDVEDIANKLWNKSIKLDPNFWFNKDIKNYQSQLDAAISKQGILNQTELQYVSWGDFTISAAQYFVNKGAFTVQKDGATATGTATLNATTGETPQQIATKIAKAQTKFNFNYWDHKNLQATLGGVKSVLINEKILDQFEASNITKITNPVTVTKAGALAVTFEINDGKTTTDVTTKLNIVNDGQSAIQLATDLDDSYQFALKTSSYGYFADDPAELKNFRDILFNNNNWNRADTNDVTLSHTFLDEGLFGDPAHATVTKDGQIQGASVILRGWQEDNMQLNPNYLNQNYLRIYVNLTVEATNTLKGYFSQNHSDSDNLGFFYQMLDNDGFHDAFYKDLPLTGTSYYAHWDNLEWWMNKADFGDSQDATSIIAAHEASTTRADGGSTNEAFAKALYNNVMNSDGFLSVMFEWHYYNFTQSTREHLYYGTDKYGFW